MQLPDWVSTVGLSSTAFTWQIFVEKAGPQAFGLNQHQYNAMFSDSGAILLNQNYLPAVVKTIQVLEPAPSPPLLCQLPLEPVLRVEKALHGLRLQAAGKMLNDPCPCFGVPSMTGSSHFTLDGHLTGGSAQSNTKKPRLDPVTPSPGDLPPALLPSQPQQTQPPLSTSQASSSQPSQPSQPSPPCQPRPAVGPLPAQATSKTSSTPADEHRLPQQPLTKEVKVRSRFTWDHRPKLHKLESRTSTTSHSRTLPQPEFACAHGVAPPFSYHSVEQHKARYKDAIAAVPTTCSAGSDQPPVFTLKFMTERGAVQAEFQAHPHPEPFFDPFAGQSDPGPRSFQDSCTLMANAYTSNTSGWPAPQRLSLLKLGLGQAFCCEAGLVPIPKALAPGTQNLSAIQKLAHSYFLMARFGLFRQQVFLSCTANDFSRHYAKPVALLIGDIVFSLMCILNQAVFFERAEDTEFAITELRKLYKMLDPPGCPPMFPPAFFASSCLGKDPPCLEETPNDLWMSPAHIDALKERGLTPALSLLGDAKVMDALCFELSQSPSSTLDDKQADFVVNAVKCFADSIEVASDEQGTYLKFNLHSVLGNVVDPDEVFKGFRSASRGIRQGVWIKNDMVDAKLRPSYIPIGFWTGVVHCADTLTNKTTARTKDSLIKQLYASGLRQGDPNELAVNANYVVHSSFCGSILNLAESTGRMFPSQDAYKSLKIFPFAVPDRFGKVLIVAFVPSSVLWGKDVRLTLRRASFRYRDDQRAVDVADLLSDKRALPALLHEWKQRDELGLGWAQRAPPMVMLSNRSQNCWINVSLNVMLSSFEQGCFDLDLLQPIEEEASGKALVEFIRATRDSSSEPYTWEQHRNDFASSATSANAQPKLKMGEGGAGAVLHFWEFLSELSSGVLKPLMFSKLVYWGTCRTCHVELSATKQRLCLMQNKKAFELTEKFFLEAVVECYLPHAYFNDRVRGFPCIECHCIVPPTTTVIDLPSKLLIIECCRIKPSEFSQFKGDLEKQRLDNKVQRAPWWRLFAVVFNKENIGWKIGHATCVVLGRDEKCAPSPVATLHMVVCP